MLEYKQYFHHCIRDGDAGAEDVELSRCLKNLGVDFVDTRDRYGRYDQSKSTIVKYVITLEIVSSISRLKML